MAQLVLWIRAERSLTILRRISLEADSLLLAFALSFASHGTDVDKASY